MSTEASAWIPLFPDEEIPHILVAILRSLTGLQKNTPLELETEITKRLRKNF